MFDVCGKPSGKRKECLFNFNDLKGAFISEWQISFFLYIKIKNLKEEKKKKKSCNFQESLFIQVIQYLKKVLFIR